VTAVAGTVAHHPADHPYVHQWSGPAPAPSSSPDVWDIDALVGRGVRIVHVHFGFEHLSPDQLANWVDRLRTAGIHLVHTVHDLDNPHLTDQRPFHRCIGVLVDAAAAVLTLTDAAASEIRARHHRESIVVPHPPVVPVGDRARVRSGHRHRDGVYVHGATLRPNLDIDLLGRLAVAARRFGGLHVHVRATAPARQRERIGRVAAATGAVLDVGPRLTDDELWHRLASARAVALPYRWGTHSGLLEAAHDLGTPVLAPTFGGYRDQGAHVVDAADVTGSIARAVAAPPMLTADDREHRRAAHAAIHARLYAGLLGVAA
jgi:glycosyltransferase involved in cell wall biosynthesis